MTPGHDDDRDLEQLDQSELDLLAYLDGELEGDALRAFEARLVADRGLAARARALSAIGGFLRDDADRVYGALGADSIADSVMAALAADSSSAPAQKPAPLTSRAVRARKNTVIWVAFGAIAAAAAGLILWTGAGELKSPGAPVARATAGADSAAVRPGSASSDIVAKVNIVPPPPSNPPAPVPETASTVEVEDLEVGSGATVVYTRGEEGSSPVVWITGREAK